MPSLVRRSLPWMLVAALLLVGSRHVRAQQGPPAQQAFSKAFALYSDSLYLQAYEVLDGFLATYPATALAPEALFYQAESALLIGRETTAQNLYRTLQARFPQHPLSRKAFLHLGKRYFEAGRYEESVRQLEYVLDGAPSDERMAEAYYWLGRARAAQGRREEAVTYYLRAAAYEHAGFADAALYAVARVQMEMGRLRAAAEAFERLRAGYPGSAHTQSVGSSLAELYYQMGDYRGAIREIERAPTEVADDPQTSFLLAQSHYQLGGYDEAIANYEDLLSQPGAVAFEQRAAYGLAWSHYLEGHHREAAERFDQARSSSVETEASDSLTALATYYQAVNTKLVGDTKQAAALFAAFADAHPSHALAPHALYERGMILAAAEQWDDAQDVFSRLLSGFPEHALRQEALRMRSEASLARGDVEAAAEDLDAALSASGGSTEQQAALQYQQARLLLQRERYAAAYEAFARFREEHPSSNRASREAMFWAGESAFQLEHYDTAASHFSSYLAAHPAGPYADAARYALAWARFRQGRYREAARLFERFLAGYDAEEGTVPYHADALLRLGDSYFALKQYDAAIVSYGQVRGAGADYASYQLAQAAANTGDAAQAIASLRELLNAYPESRWAPPARYQLGYVYLQEQRYEDAVAAYRTLIEDYPDEPLAAKAQYGIGDAYFNAGRMEAAIDAYMEVLSRYPEHAFASDAATSIQYALLALDEADRADSIIAAFARRHPDSPVVDELRFRQAEVLYETGTPEAALAAFQQFVRTSESARLLPEAYFYLGTIFADQGQIAEAENYLGQLLRRFPESPRRAEAARRLGALYLEAERFTDALDVYERLEEIAGDDPSALARARYGQSRALMALGRPQEAQDILASYLDAHPEAADVSLIQLGLARLYQAQRRTDAAERLFQQVIRQHRGDAGAEALYLLGMLHLEEGHPEQAIETFSRMPTLYPGAGAWRARSLLAQASAFEEIGDIASAERLYDQVVADFTGTPFAAEARRQKQML